LYSKIKLASKYLRYYFTASNGKGHGVHSPFVFDFIEKILNDKTNYPSYEKIELVRKELLQNENIIKVEDFGAGSTVNKTNNRVVKNIAASSLKPKKFSQLLFRIVRFYGYKNILELGTSLGITTSYLAASENTSVTTIEGSPTIATIAQQSFDKLALQNINMVVGAFEKTLLPVLQKNKYFDLVFIDGNHRKIPTIQYFKSLLNHIQPNTCIIFDDIHWSKEMEEAWEIIKMHEAVTLSIDLFFIGLIYVTKDFKIKQHFTIRF
jgi:predicted O-methyltransferase YrrM